MNQSSNEILNKILGICQLINSNLSKQGVTGGPATSGSDKAKNTGIGSLDDVIKTSGSGQKGVRTGISAIKDVLSTIVAFNKTKLDTKKMTATSVALRGLFDTIFWIGEKDRLVHRVVRLFDSLGNSLKSITAFARSMSMLLLSIGGSILMIAVSMFTAGKIFQTTPVGSMVVVTGVILGMVGLIFLIGKAMPFINPGIRVTQGIGKALLYLSGGILAFSLTLKLVSMVLGTGTDAMAIAKGIGIIALVIMGTVGAFALIGLAEPLIRKGIGVVDGMALGMLLLAGGVLALTLVGALISKIATKTSTVDESKGMFGAYGPMMKGLGVVGLVILGAVALFAGMGALSEVIIPGVAAGLLVAVGMFAFAIAIKKLATVAQSMKTDTLGTSITNMISGVTSGIINGFTGGLANGKSGWSGFVEGTKNLVLLGPAIATLTAMSIPLSMFAYAMTAFANLGNMRVIESYDKVTGKPTFGPTVNIEGIGQTITATISNFLQGLIQSTTTLTWSQSRAIQKMGRALTGKRGILAGVIQFADVLKTFAQFGPNGEIGYVDLVPDGKDEDGNVKYKQVQNKVKITTVTKNITESYIQFISAFAKNADKLGVNGEQGMKMKELSAALMGTEALSIFGWKFGKPQPGLLAPIKMFAETLTVFAKFGDRNEIALFDDNGKPLPKGVPVSTVASNIMTMLITFSDTIAKDTRATSSIDSAVKKLSEFDSLIKKLSEIGSTLDPMTKLTNNIGMLADNFSRLTTSVNELNVDKLSRVSTVANASVSSSQTNTAGERARTLIGGNVSNTTNNITTHQSTVAAATVAPQQQQPVNWDAVADRIGRVVAENIRDAIKSGMFHFEFAGKNDGVIEIR